MLLKLGAPRNWLFPLRPPRVIGYCKHNHKYPKQNNAVYALEIQRSTKPAIFESFRLRSPINKGNYSVDDLAEVRPLRTTTHCSWKCVFESCILIHDRLTNPEASPAHQLWCCTEASNQIGGIDEAEIPMEKNRSTSIAYRGKIDSLESVTPWQWTHGALQRVGSTLLPLVKQNSLR